MADAIPGLHRRTCRACGEAIALSDGDSTTERRGALVETRSARCPACHASVVYAVPVDDDRPTTKDATAWSVLKARLSHAIASRRSRFLP